MNKLITLLFLWLLIFSESCNFNNPRQLIVKKWQIDMAELKKMMKAQIAENQADVSVAEGIIEMGASMYANMTLEFKTDGTYEIEGLGNQEIGQWQMNEKNTQILMIKKANSKKETLNIKEINQKKLVLEKADVSKEDYIKAFSFKPFPSQKPK